MKLLEKLAAGVLSLSMILSASNVAAAETPTVEKRIAINSASRLMTYYENGVKKAVYPLGLGKPYTPTPVGYFKIMEKVVNPSWIDPSDPEYEIPSGPGNPLGYRWMQIRGNYGIHGTNRPESIGGYVSNGCIRMLEADVEKLFAAVDVGTPVDITYNRVVVEKIEDGNVVYYIYPDGYGWQSIDVAYVNSWLEPYGVAPFESDSNIEAKIQSSDGTPTYIGKPYNMEINGKKIEPVTVNGKNFLAKAVVLNDITYLPVVPLAMALHTKLEWREGELTLKTKYGTVTGFESKNQIYCNADDAITLLNIDGGLQNVSDRLDEGKVFKFYTINNQIDKPAKNKTPKNKSENNRPSKNVPAENNQGKPSKNKSENNRSSKNIPSKNVPAENNQNRPSKNKSENNRPSKDKSDENRSDKNRQPQETPQPNRPSKNNPNSNPPPENNPNRNVPNNNQPQPAEGVQV